MGAVSHDSRRLRGRPLQIARPAAPHSAGTALPPAEPALTGMPSQPPCPLPDAAPSLVVIIASSRAEQQRLLASVPEDVPVLVTASAEEAAALMPTLTVPPGPAPGPTVRPAERSVSWRTGSSVRLTPLEFALLRTLSLEQGRVWSFVELSHRVWETGFVGDGAQVRAVVKRLRRKLADAQAPVMVETVRGAGFRLAPWPGLPVDGESAVSPDPSAPVSGRREDLPQLPHNCPSPIVVRTVPEA